MYIRNREKTLKTIVVLVATSYKKINLAFEGLRGVDKVIQRRKEQRRRRKILRIYVFVPFR